MAAALVAALPVLLPVAAAHAQSQAQSQAQATARQRLNEALRSLARDPQYLPALLSAGQASLALDDIEAALGFFRRAEAVAPADGRVKAGMAAVMVRQGQPLEALRLFGEAEQAGEQMRLHAANRGLAYDLIGDNARAQQEYRLALASGADPVVTRRLALSQAIAGDRSGSEVTLLPLLQRSDLSAYRTRAFALAILGKTDEAVSIAETMLPERLSSRMAPYLRYMPRLTKAQQAAAANLGSFPQAAQIGREDPALIAYAAQSGAPQSARGGADARLVPRGAPLGPSSRESRIPQRQQAAPQAPAAVAGASPPVAVAPRPVMAAAPAPTPSAPLIAAAPAATASAPVLAATPAVAAPVPTAAAVPAVTVSAPALAGGPSVTASAPIVRSAPAVSASTPPTRTAPAVAPARPVVPAAASVRPAQEPSLVPPVQAAPPAAVVVAVLDSPSPEAEIPRPSISLAAQDQAPAAVGPASTIQRDLTQAFAEFSVPPEPVAPAQWAVDITRIEPRRETPPAEAKPAPPPKPVAPSRHWVQVATGRDTAALEFDWRRVKRAAGGLLDKTAPHVAAWGQTNRLVAGPFASAREANELVVKLKEKELDSFRFTSAQGEEVKRLD